MMNLLSEISFMWLIPDFGCALLLAYFLYAKDLKKEVGSKYTLYSLLGLRSLSLFFIGLLLFGLIFKNINYKIQKPILISLIDDSSSMLNYKDSNKVLSTIQSVQQKLRKKYGDKFEFVQYAIGEEVNENDSLNFSETSSFLSSGFDFIHENFFNNNIGGVIFISDGNYNKGNNPLLSSDKILHTPIFTVGVGDTVVKVDHLVKNIVSNKIAFYENDFPVKVLIESNQLKGENCQLSIYKNGKKVDSKIVEYNSDYEVQEVDFVLNASEIGYQQYSVVLSELARESNLKNNVRYFNLEVLESRNKVLFLFNAPHPDISAFKNELKKDEKIEVDAQFVSEWDGNLKGVNLVIWHEPASQFVSVQRKLEENKIPVLYVFGTNTTRETINRLPIGLSVNLRYQNDENQAIYNEQFQLFSLSEELKTGINTFPPLTTKFGSVELASINNVLLNQRIGSVAKSEPLLFFGENSFYKYGVFYGEGIWKWKFEDYKLNHSNKLFNELIQKITQYLIVRKNNSNFNVIIPSELRKNEEVVIRAEFYDEAFNLTTKPVIQFKYTNAENLEQVNEFSILDNYYTLPLGSLSPGKYKWEAKTKYNNKVVDKSGVFIVEDVYLEDLTTNANHNLLKAIAKNSNAKFYTLERVDDIILDLEKRSDIASVSYEEPKFNKLIDYVWILILITSLFIIEWFVRRRIGLQ